MKYINNGEIMTVLTQEGPFSIKLVIVSDYHIR